MKHRVFAILAGIALGAAASARGAPDKPLLGGTIQAEISEVKPQYVKLDRGSEAGIKDRQVFEIFQDTKAFSLPLSGGTRMRIDRAVIARAVVYEVKADCAYARVFDGPDKAKVAAHQVAVLNQGIAAPTLPPHVKSVSPAEKSPQASAPWRRTVWISLDVDVEPGRRAYYEWRTPGGGVFTNGVEVAPGVFRTAGPEIGWMPPIQANTYPINVTITDSTRLSLPYSLRLASQGAKQERAANPHPIRTFFSRTKFEGIRDVGFDARNNCFWLDGVSGSFSGHEYLHGTNADGIDLGTAEVKGGNFSAIALNDEYFYFLDLKETCVKRYTRGGALSAILSSEPLKIGESGSGNARFKDPVDLALLRDGGIVVLDAGQRCVHRFDADGHFLYAFGRPGDGEHDLKEPVALAAAHDGTVYVLDTGRKRVVGFKDGRSDKPDIEVGTANEELRGIAVDDFSGSIAVLDRGSGSVKLFSPTRDGWANAATSVSAGSEDVAHLKKPVRIRSDATRLVYAIDRDGDSIARFDSAERVSFVSRLGGIELSDNVRLAASAEGDVVALDRSKRFAMRFDRYGWASAKMGFEGTQGGELKAPIGVALDADGNVYVSDAKKFEIEKYQARGGAWLRALGSEGRFQKIRTAHMNNARERMIVVMGDDFTRVAVVDPQTGDMIEQSPAAPKGEIQLATFTGHIPPGAGNADAGAYWFVDDAGERVSRVAFGSKDMAQLQQDFSKVTGMAANGAGAVFICDRKAKTIYVYSAEGAKLGNGAIQDDQLEAPSDVATDDLGHLYVFDESKVRILELGE